MGSCYQLQICCRNACEVAAVLGVPNDEDDDSRFLLKREIATNGPWIDFIAEFLDLLSGKYESLEKLGIGRSNISVWFLYEYENQCNIEFAPQALLKLGEEGITLCISCWQKGGEIVLGP